MSLPADWVERYYRLAEGCTMFGIPLAELTERELRAVTAFAIEQQAKDREQHLSSMRTLSALHKGHL